jgi:truncated hemoglobin YjbI
LPSISLAPISKSLSYAFESVQNGTGAGSQLSLTFRLADDDVNMEKWSEWLRMMPDGIKDVKVEGPYRNTFR